MKLERALILLVFLGALGLAVWLRPVDTAPPHTPATGPTGQPVFAADTWRGVSLQLHYASDTHPYEQFIDVVRASRMLDDDILYKYADGRVFTGRQAVAWGFADMTGDFRDARLVAARMGGLGEDADLIRPRRASSTTVWDILLGRAGVREIREGLGLGPIEGPRTLYLMR